MKHRFFSAFLAIYFLAILFHAIEENSFTSLFFYLGIALAIFAHAKRNWMTILILFLHMAIEWFAWGNSFSWEIKNNTFMIIHVIMDFIFLSHEIKVHIKKNYYLIMFGVFFSLVSLFSYSRIEKIKLEKIENGKPKFFNQMYVAEHKKNVITTKKTKNTFGFIYLL
jgi:hypothetical protein